MRRIGLMAPLGAALVLTAFSSPAAASSAPVAPASADARTAQPARVTVAIGADLQRRPARLQHQPPRLGDAEVQRRADRLVEVVTRELSRSGALEGARVELVLTDLRPNRPTLAQMADRPGLDGFRSLSIGGAAIEGEIIAADGSRQPVRYDWYSSSIVDVRGYSTWQDADYAFSRFARNLARGQYER